MDVGSFIADDSEAVDYAHLVAPAPAASSTAAAPAAQPPAPTLRRTLPPLTQSPLTALLGPPQPPLPTISQPPAPAPPPPQASRLNLLNLFDRPPEMPRCPFSTTNPQQMRSAPAPSTHTQTNAAAGAAAAVVSVEPAPGPAPYHLWEDSSPFPPQTFALPPTADTANVATSTPAAAGAESAAAPPPSSQVYENFTFQFPRQVAPQPAPASAPPPTSTNANSSTAAPIAGQGDMAPFPWGFGDASGGMGHSNVVAEDGTGGELAPIQVLPPIRAAVDDEMASRKRKRVKHVTAPKSDDVKTSEVADSDDNDDNCCSICLEPWTAAGKHQLCVLPCGHLFGRACIDTWLRRKRQCPRCRQTMRAKTKATLIFAAPAKLAVLDQGELQALRDQLDKEKDAHRSTKKKLSRAEKERNTLQRRLNQQTAVHSFGGPPPPQHAAHTSLLQRPLSNNLNTTNTNNLATSTIQINAAPAPILGGITAATNELDVLARSHLLGRTAVVAQYPQLGGTPLPSHHANFAAPSHSHIADHGPINLMFSVSTNGSSKALAFDNLGNVLYGEKRQQRLSAGDSPQKVAKRPLINHNLKQQTRTDFAGRINDIAVCHNPNSSYNGYIAVVAQNRAITVLSPTLDVAVLYNSPSVPLSVWWPTSHPNLLVAGLVDGTIAAYDMRNSGAPLGTTHIDLPYRPNAVHSLTEVSIGNGSETLLLAATPSRIDAITFGNYTAAMSTRPVVRSVYNDEACTSLAADNGALLVSTRFGHSQGRHTVHRGLLVADHGLYLGPMLHGTDSLQGHHLASPYQRAAVLRPGNDCVVFAPDFVQNATTRFTRSWAYGTSGWSTADHAHYDSRLSSASVKAHRMSRHNVRGFAANLGDANLQVFSVR